MSEEAVPYEADVDEDGAVTLAELFEAIPPEDLANTERLQYADACRVLVLARHEIDLRGSPEQALIYGQLIRLNAGTERACRALERIAASLEGPSGNTQH